MKNIRTGLGHDRHPFGEPGSGPLALGCVAVDYDRRLEGHSDGDAIAHCIADALLSASGLPDLGTVFPAYLEANEGIAGTAILKKTAAMIAKTGWRVGNIDCVVVCDKPHLASYLPKMVANIAGALGIECGQVSIKPRHAEGLGFAGTGLGIEATAVVLVFSD
jgi:2-C-methyl-D-erythritol 2,4-cyclodiphosphate synthase